MCFWITKSNGRISTWNTSPPAPKDSFDQEDDYWDTMIAMKKLSSGDVKEW